MIIGIGVDRIVVARVDACVNRFGERFIQRVYTDREHEQARNKGMFGRRLAMLFAAKEAVAKALGTGFKQGVTPKHIETIHQPSGKPEVFLHNGAALAARRLGVTTVHVSLTDDDGIAMAFAVAEKAG
jgi:holo-[acyl-carrier protein] synthase